MSQTALCSVDAKLGGNPGSQHLHALGGMDGTSFIWCLCFRAHSVIMNHEGQS